MRFTATFPVLALSDPNLSYRDLRVLVALCYFDPKKTGACTAKRNLIARIARVSETYVSRATKTLISVGWIGERIGNGGRQRPSTYQINWHFSPAINSVQSGHGLEGVNGVQSGHGLEINGVQERHRLQDKQCPEKAPFMGQTVSSSDTPNQTTDTDTNTNLIRLGGEVSKFGFENVINILFANRVPKKFTESEQDRAIIQKWLSNGVTAARLTAACERATFSKKDGKAFGPGYLDKVLDSLAEEQSQNAGSKASNEAYAERDHASGEW